MFFFSFQVYKSREKKGRLNIKHKISCELFLHILLKFKINWKKLVKL